MNIPFSWEIFWGVMAALVIVNVISARFRWYDDAIRLEAMKVM